MQILAASSPLWSSPVMRWIDVEEGAEGTEMAVIRPEIKVSTQIIYGLELEIQAKRKKKKTEKLLHLFRSFF